MAGGQGPTRRLATFGLVLTAILALLVRASPAWSASPGSPPSTGPVDAGLSLRDKPPSRPSLGTFPPPCAGVSYPTSNCEYYSRLGQLAISPRIAAAGGSFTVSWVGPCEYTQNYGQPDQQVVPCTSDWSSLLWTFRDWKHSDCLSTNLSCTIEVPKKAATRPFSAVAATRHNDQDGGEAGTHVAILGDGQSVIQGTVTREGRPVAGINVSVGQQTVRTDAAGFYWTTATRGTSYRVSIANDGACVVGGTPCRPFTTVTGGGAKTVDFTLEPPADLALRFDAGEQGFEPDGTKFLRLRLTIHNGGTSPLTEIDLSDLAIRPTGPSAGVGACERTPSVELASGPSPAAPQTLEPGGNAALAYRVHVAAACGPVRIGAYVSAKDSEGATLTAARGIDLAVEDAVAERAFHILSSFDALQRSAAESLAARRASLEAELNAGLPRTPDGSYNAVLEDWAGVPRGTFSWLPQNSDQSIVLYDAYSAGMKSEARKMFVDFSWKVGNGFTAAFDLMFNEGRMSNREGALWAMRATDAVLALGPGLKGGTDTWLGTSWQHLSGNAPPGAYDAVMAELYRDIASFDLSASVTEAIDQAADDYRAQAVQFRADYEKDPAQAAEDLGRASARLAVTQTKAVLTELLTEKGLGLMMRGLAKSRVAASSRFLGDGFDEGLRGAFEQRRGLAALPDGAVVTLDEASRLGGIRADRLERAQQVIATMEADGIKDVKISFTPSNPLSMGLVQDGMHVVKEEFQTGSTITKLDLLLGADPRAGGKYAVYKPQWPAVGREKFLSELPAEDRPAVLKWFSERQKQYDAALAGTHPIARAAREGGATFDISAGVGQPRKQATWEVEIEKYGDTWVPRNKELTIDGAQIGKPGMYTTADLDMHVYSAKASAQINPLALRESLRKADLGVPFHGSTVNAWDLDPNKPSDWVTYFKFQLAQMDPAEAERLAQSCADAINKRFKDAAWVDKKVTVADLLSPKMTNKVLTVTRSNVLIEYGPAPRP